MPANAPHPTEPTQGEEPRSRPAYGPDRRWLTSLTVLILGWAGIALINLFIHGLIARPTGLILVGLLLGVGWALVTLLNHFMVKK